MEGESLRRTSQIKEMLGAMKEQWQSMLGMAAMFVITILIGIVIQPFYDKPEFRAFGEVGASQVRNILLEFTMILVFTATIIYLAKKKKDWIIKYGILGILFIALCYATIPLTNLVISEVPEPLKFDSSETDYEIIHQHNDGFYVFDKLINQTTGDTGGYAFYSLSNAYSEAGVAPINMLHQGIVLQSNKEALTFSKFSDGIIVCDGEQFMKIDENFDVATKLNKNIIFFN